jgi:MFS family permease
MVHSGANNEVPPSPTQPPSPTTTTTTTSATATATADAGAQRIVPTKRLLATMVITIICFIVVADVQGVALSPLVGTIAADLSLSNSEVGWIITCYTLVGAAFSGILSRLGDVLGPKRVLAPMMGAAIIGSIVCALAPSLEVLIVGRMLLGFSVPAVALMFGLVRPVASARQARKITFGVGASAACGVSLSVGLSGVFVVNDISWHALFLVSASFLTVGLVLLLLTPDPSGGRPTRVPLDLVGGLGLGVWLTFILLTLTYGPVEGWTAPRVVLFAVIGIVVLVGWILQQARNPHRLMAFRRDDLRQMLSGYSAVWLGGYVSPSVLLIVLPALLQTPANTGYGFGLTLLQSVLPLLLFGPAGVVCMLILPTLMEKFGPRTVLVAGALMTALTFLTLAFAVQTYAITFVLVFLYAVSAHLLVLGGNSMTTASGRQDNISVTYGLQYASGNIVASMAVAVILAFLAPNADGIVPQSTFTAAFIGAAVVLLLGAVALFLFVPRTFLDRHAIPAPTSSTVVAHDG